MQVITSKDNEIIKGLKKLKEKKYRDEEGLYIIEGIKIIEEAIADSQRDQAANRLGRERRRKYPYCDCSILMHDLLPDYKK